MRSAALEKHSLTGAGTQDFNLARRIEPISSSSFSDGSCFISSARVLLALAGPPTECTHAALCDLAPSLPTSAQAGLAAALALSEPPFGLTRHRRARDCGNARLPLDARCDETLSAPPHACSQGLSFDKRRLFCIYFDTRFSSARHPRSSLPGEHTGTE